MAAGGPTDAAADAANANAPGVFRAVMPVAADRDPAGVHTMASGMSRQETVTAVIADV